MRGSIQEELSERVHTGGYGVRGRYRRILSERSIQEDTE